MLQIVTVNVGGHRNYRETPVEPLRVAKEIKANIPLDYSKPTIIALQEVIQISFDDGEMLDIGQLLAKELGNQYQACFAPRMSSLTHPHATGWDKPGYRGAPYAAEGNSILTNLPFAGWPWPNPAKSFPGHHENFSIVTPIGRPQLYSTGTRDTEPRNLIVASLAAPYGPVYFMATHLSTLKGEDRHNISQEASRRRLTEARHILCVLEELRDAEKRHGKDPRMAILAGDFNVEPDQPEMQELLSEFTRLEISGNEESVFYTYPEAKIDIDHIFVDDPNCRLGTPSTVYIRDNLKIPDVMDHLPKIALFRD